MDIERDRTERRNRLYGRFIGRPPPPTEKSVCATRTAETLLITGSAAVS